MIKFFLLNQIFIFKNINLNIIINYIKKYKIKLFFFIILLYLDKIK